jgi:hypothetical protein
MHAIGFSFALPTQVNGFGGGFLVPDEPQLCATCDEVILGVIAFGQSTATYAHASPAFFNNSARLARQQIRHENSLCLKQ